MNAKIEKRKVHHVVGDHYSNYFFEKTNADKRVAEIPGSQMSEREITVVTTEEGVSYKLGPMVLDSEGFIRRTESSSEPGSGSQRA